MRQCLCSCSKFLTPCKNIKPRKLRIIGTLIESNQESIFEEKLKIDIVVKMKQKEKEGLWPRYPDVKLHENRVKIL